jgi:hypothetical protein
VRTTLDLDPLILAALEERQRAEGKSLGQMVSELLAPALRQEPTRSVSVKWPSQAMHALVNIDDDDEVWSLLDRS